MINRRRRPLLASAAAARLAHGVARLINSFRISMDPLCLAAAAAAAEARKWRAPLPPLCFMIMRAKTRSHLAPI